MPLSLSNNFQKKTQIEIIPFYLLSENLLPYTNSLRTHAKKLRIYYGDVYHSLGGLTPMELNDRVRLEITPAFQMIKNIKALVSRLKKESPETIQSHFEKTNRTEEKIRNLLKSYWECKSHLARK